MQYSSISIQLSSMPVLRHSHRYQAKIAKSLRRMTHRSDIAHIPAAKPLCTAAHLCKCQQNSVRNAPVPAEQIFSSTACTSKMLCTAWQQLCHSETAKHAQSMTLKGVTGKIMMMPNYATRSSSQDLHCATERQPNMSKGRS